LESLPIEVSDDLLGRVEAAAHSLKMSVNDFINDAIDDKLQERKVAQPSSQKP
jgi:predicted transcriptional regulator